MWEGEGISSLHYYDQNKSSGSIAELEVPSKIRREKYNCISGHYTGESDKQNVKRNKNSFPNLLNLALV